MKPKPSKFRYRPQFGLILKLKSEAEQMREFKRLKKLGYEPRVVCV